MNKVIPDFRDSFIVIEMTDICNLNCNFCIQSSDQRPHGTQKGFISEKIFKKIIDDLVKDNIQFGFFEPFWFGESLIHPKFKELFSYYLKRKQKISHGWQLDTNATLLSSSISTFLLSKNQNFPSAIHFSIDAASNRLYNKIRGKDYYDLVIKNIENFMKIKTSLHFDFPELIFQFIVTKENFSELHSFISFWQKQQKKFNLGGTIYLKQKDGGNLKENLSLFEKAKLIKIESTVKYEKFNQFSPSYETPLPVCGSPFKSLIITKDGDCTVCCQDVKLDLKIGNVKEKSIYDIWYNNSSLNRLRIDILKGKYSEKRCKSCEFKYSSNIPKITRSEAIEFLKFIKKEDEIGNIPLLNKKPSFLDKPWLRSNWWLTLELNATCNLKCPMCSQYVDKIKGDQIRFKDVKKTIDECIKNNTTFYCFTPFFRGESLLHPEFDKIIRYLTKASREYHLWDVINLHTNATLLTKKKANLLLDFFNSSLKSEIFFSIDAATQKTYSKIRIGGNLQKVKENIKYFIKQKLKKKLPNPKMIFQFIVMKENYKEAVDFYRYWTNILNKYNEKYVLAETYDRFLNTLQYETNIIYFRRKENPRMLSEESLDLLKKVLSAVKNEKI